MKYQPATETKSYQAHAIIDGNEISRPARWTKQEAQQDAELMRETYPTARILVLDLRGAWGGTVVYEVA